LGLVFGVDLGLVALGAELGGIVFGEGEADIPPKKRRASVGGRKKGGGGGGGVRDEGMESEWRLREVLEGGGGRIWEYPLYPGGIDQGIKFSCVNLGVELGGVKLGKAVSIAPVFKRSYSEMNTFSRAK
jgi:hypothetical protein